MKLLATLALASLAALSLDIGAAVASHFQYATLSWKPIQVVSPDTTVVKINLRMGFRRNGNYAIPPGTGSFPGGCDALADPGDIMWDNQGPTYLDFGDGTFSSLTEALKFSVTSFDCAPGAEHNFLVADAINPPSIRDAGTGTGGALLRNVGIRHTYVGPGPFTVKLSTFPGSGDPCCRIGQFPQFGFPCLNNRSEGVYQVETVVSPQSGNNSPVTGMPVRLTVPRGVASTFSVPGADPDGDPLRWRLSTEAEAGGGAHPAGMSIDANTGLVTWDNSLLDGNCAWTTQVMVEDLDGGMNVKSKSPVDFLLFICDASPNAPVFDAGPACGGSMTVAACQALSFPVSASDADGGDVSLAVSGLPVGATMSPAPPTSGNPVSSTFSWTPKSAQVGTHVITFIASDGCNQTLCAVTVTVTPSATVPVFTAGPPHNGIMDIKACQTTTFTLEGTGGTLSADGWLDRPTGLPVGATLAAGVFTWRPNAGQVGLHVIDFLLSDGCTGVIRTVKLNVIPNPSTPQFVGGPSCGSTVEIPYGQLHSFVRTATDTEALDRVTLSATGLPAGATMTPALPLTGAAGAAVASTFNWTPTAAQIGLRLIVFTAADGPTAATTCNSNSCPVSLLVVNRPPDVSQAVACVPTLGSPNHKLHAVEICGVTDPDGGPVTITATGITQDEQVNIKGSGSTCPDAQIVGGQASVRAERFGTPGISGNGRVYAISFTAVDTLGGTSQGVVNVCVPFETGVACVDDGQRYNSLGPCTGGKPVDPEVAVVPTEFSLTVGRAAGSLVSLEFGLPQDTQVDLSVFDVAGRRMATVESGQLTAGLYQRTWDTRGATNGLYFVRLRAGSETLTKTVARIQ